MRVLVTGGGGFIGTVLVRQVLAFTASDVTVLERFSWGVQPLLGILEPADVKRVRIVVGDIRNPATVADAVSGCDVIVHLAGIVGYPACDADPHDAETTNVDGTRVLVETGCPVIFASTGSTYGIVTGEATEQTPLNPLTLYGRTKALGEQMVLDYGGTVLRLATLYGLSPRMRWDLLVHDFAQRAVQDGRIAVYEGHARRTFLHVEDAANAFVSALDRTIGPGVWNIGSSGQNYTKDQIARVIAEHTGCHLVSGDGHDSDRRDYAVNYSKVARVWEPIWTLDESLPGVVQAARVWR